MKFAAFWVLFFSVNCTSFSGVEDSHDFTNNAKKVEKESGLSGLAKGLIGATLGLAGIGVIGGLAWWRFRPGKMPSDSADKSAVPKRTVSGSTNFVNLSSVPGNLPSEKPEGERPGSSGGQPHGPESVPLWSEIERPRQPVLSSLTPAEESAQPRSVPFVQSTSGNATFAPESAWLTPGSPGPAEETSRRQMPDAFAEAPGIPGSWPLEEQGGERPLGLLRGRPHVPLAPRSRAPAEPILDTIGGVRACINGMLGKIPDMEHEEPPAEVITRLSSDFMAVLTRARELDCSLKVYSSETGDCRPNFAILDFLDIKQDFQRVIFNNESVATVSPEEMKAFLAKANARVSPLRLYGGDYNENFFEKIVNELSHSHDIELLIEFIFKARLFGITTLRRDKDCFVEYLRLSILATPGGPAFLEELIGEWGKAERSKGQAGA